MNKLLRIGLSLDNLATHYLGRRDINVTHAEVDNNRGLIYLYVDVPNVRKPDGQENPTVTFLVTDFANEIPPMVDKFLAENGIPTRIDQAKDVILGKLSMGPLKIDLQDANFYGFKKEQFSEAIWQLVEDGEIKYNEHGKLDFV